MNIFNNLFILWDAPQPWQINLQYSASPQMEALVELHDNIMFYLYTLENLLYCEPIFNIINILVFFLAPSCLVIRLFLITNLGESRKTSVITGICALLILGVLQVYVTPDDSKILADFIYCTVPDNSGSLNIFISITRGKLRMDWLLFLFQDGFGVTLDHNGFSVIGVHLPGFKLMHNAAPNILPVSVQYEEYEIISYMYDLYSYGEPIKYKPINYFHGKINIRLCSACAEGLVCNIRQ